MASRKQGRGKGDGKGEERREERWVRNKINPSNTYSNDLLPSARIYL